MTIKYLTHAKLICKDNVQAVEGLCLGRPCSRYIVTLESCALESCLEPLPHEKTVTLELSHFSRGPKGGSGLRIGAVLDTI
jgi:hypothetical protein